METTQVLIPYPTKRRAGIKNLGIKFIVCHDTANDGSTAKGNANYFVQSANLEEASAHYFVDDKYTVLCVPENEKAWHVRRDPQIDNQMFGCEANDCALGIELCYSTRGVFDSRKAYTNYCNLIRSLCQKYNLNPATSLVGHYTLDPERRNDPINAFSKIGKTWDQFVQDVIHGEQIVQASPQTVRTLKLGMSGDDVKNIQTLLTNRGFPTGSIDGSFGPKTLNAVMSFQRTKGLVADGVVGPKTLLALNS